MSDLENLYQEVLLDHYKRPRHFGELAEPTGRAEGNNPLCGDRVTVEVRVAGERLADVAFRGSGCAISIASASLMSEAVRDRPLAEVIELAGRFVAAVKGGGGGAGPAVAADADSLGKLAALLGVRQFPMRVKCATLAWHALEAALAGGGMARPVSTE